jgi:hypothetical protein
MGLIAKMYDGDQEPDQYSARYSSNSSQQERYVAQLRHDLQQNQRVLQSMMAAAQSAEAAQGISDFGHDQANSNITPRGRNQTMNLGQKMTPMKDQPAYEDIDLGYDSAGRDSGTWGSHAGTQFPDYPNFVGSTPHPRPKVKHYRRGHYRLPPHLREEGLELATMIGSPVLRFSTEDLEAQGIQSTSMIPLLF